jgi:hypothetical protein
MGESSMQHEDGTQKEWKAYVDENKVNAFTFPGRCPESFLPLFDFM